MGGSQVKEKAAVRVAQALEGEEIVEKIGGPGNRLTKQRLSVFDFSSFDRIILLDFS